MPAVRPQTQEVDTYTHVETGESLSLAQLREHPDFASEKRWDPNLSDHQWMKQMEDQGVTDWAHSVETQTVQTPVLDQFGAQAFDEKFVITAATQAAGKFTNGTRGEMWGGAYSAHDEVQKLTIASSGNAAHAGDVRDGARTYWDGWTGD